LRHLSHKDFLVNLRNLADVEINISACTTGTEDAGEDINGSVGRFRTRARSTPRMWEGPKCLGLRPLSHNATSNKRHRAEIAFNSNAAKVSIWRRPQCVHK
jgi:hypothetical protein